MMKGCGSAWLPHRQMPPYRQPCLLHTQLVVPRELPKVDYHTPCPRAFGFKWMWQTPGLGLPGGQGSLHVPVAPEEEMELMESAVSSRLLIRATLYNLFSIFLSSNLQAFKRYFGWLVCTIKITLPSVLKGTHCVEPVLCLPLEVLELTFNVCSLLWACFGEVSNKLQSKD